MRPKGSVRELEVRRRKALKLLEQDLSLNEVARRLDCHPSSVMRWRDRFHKFGEAGLTAQSPPGRPSRLSEKQQQQLFADLLAGPAEFGFRTQIWTTQRIAEVIEKRFGISYHRDHIGKLMHSLGWIHQIPERRAVERNEAAIGEWEDTEPSRAKKNPSGWAPA